MINPLRYVGDLNPALIGLFALCCAILAVNGWVRLRERRGDWGPGLPKVPPGVGYAPADLRSGTAPPMPEDPQERWLLGLAAPYVETAGLRHHRWSLVPAPCDDAWRRRLVIVADSWGVPRARAWRDAVAQLEEDIGQGPSAAQNPVRLAWLTANLAMLLRLGVAARFTSGHHARKRLRTAAEALHGQFSTWLDYGDALVTASEALTPGATTALRADLHRLYAAGGPWHEVGWPE